jgi:hypothetical protein
MSPPLAHVSGMAIAGLSPMIVRSLPLPKGDRHSTSPISQHIPSTPLVSLNSMLWLIPSLPPGSRPTSGVPSPTTSAVNGASLVQLAWELPCTRYSPRSTETYLDRCRSIKLMCLLFNKLNSYSAHLSFISYE